jgi:hypothetical protein
MGAKDKLAVVGDRLSGRGLSFDISALVRAKVDSGECAERLVEICEALYLQGRESLLFSRDDRFDLSLAVETLRALAVVVGPGVAGERHRRAADVIGRLLQEQDGGE